MVLQAGKMYRPSDVAFDTSNNIVYVVEQFSHRISKWDYTPGFADFTLDAGHVTSIDFSGGGGTMYSVGDPIIIGPPTLDIANPVTASAQVSSESGGVIDGILITQDGNGYDPNNLPTVTAPTSGTPAILTAVVSAPWGSNGDGTSGQGGPVTGTTDNSLYRPLGIAFDGTRLYVTDTFHDRIRVVDPSDGSFDNSVGTGGFGDANFYHPAGIAVDDANTFLVIADELNHRAVRYSADATPVFQNVLPDPSGVDALSIDIAGTGYTVAPIVTITGGGGTGATATATSDGNTVDSITLTNAGVGYTSIPTVTISAPDTPGTQATASATIKGKLSFVRPHGVVYDVNSDFFNVTDSARGLISKYNLTGTTFVEQFGTPGTTGDELFFPSSGVGVLTGTNGTVFADTRNNSIKTVDDTAITNTSGTTAGTGVGQIYFPESVSAFSDTDNYVLAANTLNNRVEIFSNSGTTLTFETNFGSPILPITLTTSLSVGTTPRGMAVNERTNRIYMSETVPTNSVAVIDGVTNTVIDKIVTPSSPHGIAVNDTTNRIYATNNGLDSVSVINGDTNTIIGSPIMVGNNPDGIAVNEITNRIYVVNNSDDTVSVINGDTNTIIGSPIPVGNNPENVAVNKKTNTIYVSNRIGDTVSVIDGVTNVVTNTIFIGDRPLGVAVNEITNRIYVANNSDDTVSVINGDTNTIIGSPIPVGNDPVFIAVNGTTNSIYLSTFETIDDTVSVIDGNSNTVIAVSPVPGSEAIRAVAVNERTNSIYVARGTGTGTLSVFSAN